VSEQRQQQADVEAGKRITAALARLDWAPDLIVRQEDGWQLRPRLAGEPVAVRLQATADGARLTRVVVRQLPESGDARQGAVVQQALRLNARLRGARLARRGRMVVAESRLHGKQLGSSWIRDTAYAVATAARAAGDVLKVLAEQREVACLYLDMFGIVPDSSASPLAER
jgi:hypothetical protein